MELERRREVVAHEELLADGRVLCGVAPARLRRPGDRAVDAARRRRGGGEGVEHARVAAHEAGREGVEGPVVAARARRLDGDGDGQERGRPEERDVALEGDARRAEAEREHAGEEEELLRGFEELAVHRRVEALHDDAQEGHGHEDEAEMHRRIVEEGRRACLFRRPGGGHGARHETAHRWRAYQDLPNHESLFARVRRRSETMPFSASQAFC